MSIRIITASAGSGKTHRLTEILDEAIASGRVRPEGIAAVTFTRQAAAELVERARGRLLQSQRVLESHRLLAARIGTVNAVCGALVSDHAFELGLSPELQILDAHAAELEFRRVLGRVVTPALADELEQYKQIFESDLDWRTEVRRVVEAARANGIGAAALTDCAARSRASFDGCLGATTADDLDDLLSCALETACVEITATAPTQKNTLEYVALLGQAKRDLARGRLSWGMWAALVKKEPGKKLVAFAEPVQAVARRHAEHPRLRTQVHALVDHVFTIAAAALDAYQEHKRALGMLDFVDQETLALELLRRDDVRDALRGQLDLFLVDEFQDTSPIQLAVFLELAALARESIWVGDPKQAIFGFRGTDPALMDAAIESLTSLTGDGDLVAAAAAAMGRGQVETLDTSYRSRPGLVALTSEIFAGAFASQGMPAARVKLTPSLVADPPGLGEIVQYWPLDGKNGELRAMAAATGVRDLLARGTAVRDRDAVRPAQRKDVAVLCRTNAQCRAVAAALGGIGIPAVVPRTGLTSTYEALVALAALTLWLDPRDPVAAASLARVITYPEDLDGLVARVLEQPGREAFAADPTVARVLAARASQPDLGPIAALDAVLAATALRQLCAEWGNAALRSANLDALRAHASDYVARAEAAGDAATVVGLLGYYDELAEVGDWRTARTDSQALLAGGDAVTISTWHAAKGLEWPVTVLYGLEAISAPRSWSVHVISEQTAFDVSAPLAGRWIRYWPLPYTNPMQLGAVRELVEASRSHQALCAKAAREALRVLYVGWTRARDCLVLAVAPGKLFEGIFGTLSAIDPALLCEPPATPGVARVTWASVAVDALVVPAAPAPDAPGEREAGDVTVLGPAVVRARARLLPSQVAATPATVGTVTTLGDRLHVTGSPDMEFVGKAVHAFLAADRTDDAAADRLQLATDLLAAHGVPGCLAAADIVLAADRFWSWCASAFPSARAHREWPVAQRRADGTIVAGTADLVLSAASHCVVVDHKTFPGALDQAPTRALGYAGQLDAYGAGVSAALAVPVASAWVHFPVLGCVVQVVPAVA